MQLLAERFETYLMRVGATNSPIGGLHPNGSRDQCCDSGGKQTPTTTRSRRADAKRTICNQGVLFVMLVVKS